MIRMDFEDFVEEAKFQMTEYDQLNEEIILDWEKRIRKWITSNKNPKKWIVINRYEIIMILRDEDVPFEVAERFYRAYKNNKLEEYFKVKPLY